MNFRPSTIIWMLLLACGFVGLYMVKYKVQSLKNEVAASERKLMEEKRSLHVLEAEWSYLARPERLEQLSGKYLQLSAVNGRQLGDFSSLPIGNAVALMQKVAAKSAPVSNGTGIALASRTAHER